MKKKYLSIIVILISFSTFSQYNFEVSKENPFGKYNPIAPKALKDYEDLIGLCNCTSESRKPDGSWAEPINMIWRWKYIMNGMALQDETLKEDGLHSGSIRQYDTIIKQWNVHYYASASIPQTLSTWNGNKTEEGKIVLYKKQNAPNGTEGYFRLTFYDISKNGYKWIGEWTDLKENIVFPTWKINCLKTR